MWAVESELMSSDFDQQHRRPEGRYPRPSRGWRPPRWVVAVLIVVGAMLTVWLGWGLIQMDRNKLAWDSDSFTIVSDEEVSVTFRVSKATKAPVRCDVQAQNGQFSIIGVASTRIAADAPRNTEHVVTVKTIERAVSASVAKCVIDK